MPIYRAKIEGRKKPVLLKADSAAKARDQLVDVETLSSSDMMDAIEAGEKVWKPGEPLPEDEPAEKAESPAKE